MARSSSRRRAPAISRRTVELGKEGASNVIRGLNAVGSEPSYLEDHPNRVDLMRRRLATLALFCSCIAVVYGSASCAASAAASQPAAHASLAPREPNADEQVAQALSRLTFGPRPGDAARVKAMGVDRWIDAQLHPERLSDSETDAFLARYSTLALNSSEIFREFPPAALLRAAARRDSLQRSG